MFPHARQLGTLGTYVPPSATAADKIMEDLRWSYDPSDWMRPWRVRAEHSGMVDLTLEPIYAERAGISVGIVSSGGLCCFGRWHGTIRCDGRAIEIRELIGWAEEFAHRWEGMHPREGWKTKWRAWALSPSDSTMASAGRAASNDERLPLRLRPR